MLNLKFDSLLDFAEAFPNEEACIKYLEQLIWYGIPVSPFNRASKVYICANGKYFCKETKKYFTIKTGTMLENSKISLRQWFMATYLVTSNSSGCSATNLARKIGVTRKTAHYMLLKLSVNCCNKKNEDDQKIILLYNYNCLQYFVINHLLQELPVFEFEYHASSSHYHHNQLLLQILIFHYE